MKSPILSVAVLLSLCLGACQASDSSARRETSSGDTALEFTTLASGSTSGLRQAESRVVRTEFGWRELWARHVGEGGGPAPAVDFSTQMVVLVALGERSSTGYSIEIVRVVGDAGFLRVEAREQRPAGDAGAALTQPFAMLRLPRSTAPLQVQILR